MQNSNKTTIAGFIGGLIPIIMALLNAYQSGQFNGQNSSQIATGIAIMVLGYLAKDFNVTGGNIDNNKTVPADEVKKN